MEYYNTEYPSPLFIEIDRLRFQVMFPDGGRIDRLIDRMRRGLPIDPIHVYPLGGDGKHAVIDGAHRVAAAYRLGHSHVPCVVGS